MERNKTSSASCELIVNVPSKAGFVPIKGSIESSGDVYDLMGAGVLQWMLSKALCVDSPNHFSKEIAVG
jgi:hypothetical protein